MIKISICNDFYAEGKAYGFIFQMNKVESGWSLAIDNRHVGVFDSYLLAYEELLSRVVP